MRIKKFTGLTVNEAKEKMRAEFGEDAVVLNTRRVSKSGLLGMGHEEFFEVTAAFDDSPVKVMLPAKGATKPNQGQAVLNSLQQISNRFEEKRKSAPAAKPAAAQFAQASASVGTEVLRQEISDVKSALGEIAQHIKHSRMPILSENLKSVYMTLTENEVEEEIALEIVQLANHKLGGSEIENHSQVESHVLNLIAGRMIEAPVRRAAHKAYVIALVGPTGVGKTTTVAKLASISKLVRGEKVALITADTYRIGAIDQLKAFADIASIPMTVVYTPDEMISAIRKYSTFDTIYVDTVGRSQRSADKIIELGRFIDAADPNEVHLVLSANFALSTVRDIYKKFKCMKPNRLLITKMDEAVSLGMLLSISRDSRLPFSFVTMGQSVPDDIEPASPKKLSKMIFRVGVEANA